MVFVNYGEKIMKLKVKYLENYNKEWGLLKSENGNSGYDIRAGIAETIILKPNERKVIPNGIKLEIVSEEPHEINSEIQLRPRSGLAAKHGITVVNTPGTVDYNYRGEVMTILLNTGTDDFIINPGDRIGQIVVTPIFKPTIIDASDVSDSNRGENGFGSSGVK